MLKQVLRDCAKDNSVKLKLFSKNSFCSGCFFCDLWFCCSHLRLELLFLCWQLDFLAFDNFGNIEVEEVTVKNSLDGAGADCDEVVESFVVVSVHPVEQVKTSVHAQSEQIVAGDRFSFAGFTDHK